MKKITLLLMVGITSLLFGAEGITGVWKSIDETTELVSSISVIYEYEGQLYGRILVTYEKDGTLLDTYIHPGERAVALIGEPFYAGLDFIWGMKDKGKKWSSGKIMDPEPAKVYFCNMWRVEENLVVRGKIGPFGRNQVWVPILDNKEFPENFVIPKNLIPIIPKAKIKIGDLTHVIFSHGE